MTIFDIHTQQLKTSIHLFKGEVAIERAETKALLNCQIRGRFFDPVLNK